MIRVKIAIKDPTKIPMERLVVMGKKLYWLSFKVEGEIVQEEGEDPRDDKGNDEYEDGSAKEKQEDNNMMNTDHKRPTQTKASTISREQG